MANKIVNIYACKNATAVSKYIYMRKQVEIRIKLILVCNVVNAIKYKTCNYM